MAKADTLGFVQFIHPGREQVKHRGGFCEWGKTSSPHGRKFMLNDAAFIRDGREERGPVAFWGEWEGPSLVKPLRHRAGSDGPRCIHRIAYYTPSSLVGLWDTDPFVFGDRFLYNGCQQHTGFDREGGPSETFLRRLAAGSVILFGSSISRRFVIDTVFVVGDHTDYPNGEYEGLIDLVPPEYLDIGLRTQALSEPTVDSYRLYRGATVNELVGGMYSFTPCRSITDGDIGFERPGIVMPGFITQSLTQGKKLNVVPDLSAMHDLWSEVIRQVRAAGCSLAHHIAFSPKRML